MTNCLPALRWKNKNKTVLDIRLEGGQLLLYLLFLCIGLSSAWHSLKIVIRTRDTFPIGLDLQALFRAMTEGLMLKENYDYFMSRKVKFRKRFYLALLIKEVIKTKEIFPLQIYLHRAFIYSRYGWAHKYCNACHFWIFKLWFSIEDIQESINIWQRTQTKYSVNWARITLKIRIGSDN